MSGPEAAGAGVPRARPTHGRSWLWAVVVGLVATTLGAAAVSAECLPSGRREYSEALEALGSGHLSKSTRLLLTLLEAQPSCAEIRNNLAVAFVEQGRLQDAAQQLREALRLRPDYPLAQHNLERLDALVAMRAPPTPAMLAADEPEMMAPESPTPAPPPPPPTPTAGGDAQEERTQRVLPTKALPTHAAAAATASPSHTPDPRLATVSVIEPSLNRICVQQRNSQGATGETCFAIAAAQVRTWPRWLVATELTPQRIRLRDESGQLRLEIVRDNVSVTGDALRLRQGDFDELATKIIPWRTAWVILE